MTTAQEVAPYVVEVIEAGPAAVPVAFYGQAYRTTSGTMTFVASNTYYDVTLVPTLDAIASGVDVVSGKFGLQNTSGATRTAMVQVEVDISGSNNVDYGFRLSKNGTAIPATEIKAHVNGTSEVHGMMTSWIVSLATSETIVLQVANLTNTSSLTMHRGRIIATYIA